MELFAMDDDKTQFLFVLCGRHRAHRDIYRVEVADEWKINE